MADSSRSFRAQPRGGRYDTRPVSGGGAVAPASSGRGLRLVLCLLFLGSSVISLTGLIFFIGWIVAL